jgi:hypothetical protein
MGGVRRQGPPLLTQEGGAAWLATQVAERRVFAAGKIGTSELNAILFYTSNRASAGTSRPPYPDMIRRHMYVNAGLFPAASESLDAALDDWCAHMIRVVLPAMNGLAEWNPISPLYEAMVLNAYAPESARFSLRSLEPYYCARRQHKWTAQIPAGASIAVVSPFARTIAQQYAKPDVWSSESPWPSPAPALHTVRCGYSPALTADDSTCAWEPAIRAGGWRAAVESLTDAVCASGATVAVLGCGALSLPVAAALKARGVSAIHLGGATQILFGVKGRRWTHHDVISRFFTDAWVLPAPEEVPSGAALVENGCYW